MTCRIESPAGSLSLSRRIQTILRTTVAFNFVLNRSWNNRGNSSDSDLRRAAILIHELNHDLFGDQKVDGKTVYGEALAKRLAKKRPRRARRSAENFEWYCMRRRDPTGKL